MNSEITVPAFASFSSYFLVRGSSSPAKVFLALLLSQKPPPMFFLSLMRSSSRSFLPDSHSYKLSIEAFVLISGLYCFHLRSLLLIKMAYDAWCAALVCCNSRCCSSLSWLVPATAGFRQSAIGYLLLQIVTREQDSNDFHLLVTLISLIICSIHIDIVLYYIQARAKGQT